MSAINGKYKKMAPFLDQSQDTFTRMNIDPVERKKAIAEMKKKPKRTRLAKEKRQLGRVRKEKEMD